MCCSPNLPIYVSIYGLRRPLPLSFTKLRANFEGWLSSQWCERFIPPVLSLKCVPHSNPHIDTLKPGTEKRIGNISTDTISSLLYIYHRLINAHYHRFFYFYFCKSSSSWFLCIFRDVGRREREHEVGMSTSQHFFQHLKAQISKHTPQRLSLSRLPDIKAKEAFVVAPALVFLREWNDSGRCLYILKCSPS